MLKKIEGGWEEGAALNKQPTAKHTHSQFALIHYFIDAL